MRNVGRRRKERRSTYRVMQERDANGVVDVNKRFRFGRNWLGFLETVDESQIALAQRSFCELLPAEYVDGKSFLDIGCGSGMSSLIASRLGADVLAFDYDAESVAASSTLKRRFATSTANWRIEQGSVLDSTYLERLGEWDIVYSWGVLHHTGSMWLAIELALQRVAPGGILAIALYNDQGFQSRLWRLAKRLYVVAPPLRPLLLGLCAPILWCPSLTRETVSGRAKEWWSLYRSQRGMSRWHDLVDWVGGYPFEVASPNLVVAFCEERGLRLERAITTKRLGCNQFRFRRVTSVP